MYYICLDIGIRKGLTFHFIVLMLLEYHIVLIWKKEK